MKLMEISWNIKRRVLGNFYLQISRNRLKKAVEVVNKLLEIMCLTITQPMLQLWCNNL